MRNFRIEFTEMDVFGGRIIDRVFSTKWMTTEELEASTYLGKQNAKVVTR